MRPPEESRACKLSVIKVKSLNSIKRQAPKGELEVEPGFATRS